MAQERINTCIEEINIFLVDAPILFEALEWVTGCEQCSPNAVISFDYIMDATTGADPTITEYIMYQPVKCPSCSAKITEKTCVTVS
jgi:hypothetical protein